MTSIPWRFPLVGWILLVGGGPACGGEGELARGNTYADPSGFSFTYSEGWVPVTRDSMRDVHRAVPAELKTWITKNRIDLNRVAVSLFYDDQDELMGDDDENECRANLNVVVVSGQPIPLDDGSVKKLAEGLTQQYRAVGMRVDNIQGRAQQVGPYKAAVMEYQMRMPQVPYLLRQKQVMFPGTGKTYIVTCTARAESFDSYRPTFDESLASFRLPTRSLSGVQSQMPPPVPYSGGGFGLPRLSRLVKTAVVGGIVGGLVGLLFWAVSRFSRKPKPEQEGDRPPDAAGL